MFAKDKCFLSRLADIQVRNERTTISGLKAEEGESADQRIIRKLTRQQVRQKVILKLKQNSPNIVFQLSYKRDRCKKPAPWVPTQKLPRLLTTSSSAIRKIERMGEIKGVSIKRQRLEEQQVRF